MVAYPKATVAPQSDRKPSKYPLYAADVAVSTTPPGSPPPPPPLPEPPAPEEEEDDRPYDPEEEYDPERAFDTQPVERGRHPEVERVPEAGAAEREEVAYDPEDETILEEAKVTVDDLPNRMCADVRRNSTERPAEQVAGAATPSLVEQQKMLEELNKQIEEQKRQLEEQEEALRQQRAAVGVSMAHFSVSDALMSPPPKSSLPKAELFQQEQQPADKPASLPPASQAANQRDPRQARRLAAESGEGEGDPLSRLSAWGAQGTLPTRDASRGALVGQILTPVPEEKELASSPWASGEKLPAGPEQDSWKAEPGDGARPVTAGDSSARPARRVLLPTPPCGALQPGFPLQHDGERDPFSSPGFVAQDKALGSTQAPPRSPCQDRKWGAHSPSFRVQVMKPGPRPLLELPSHPPQHRQCAPCPLFQCARTGPRGRRTGKGHEYRNQTFEGRQRERFDAGPKEKPLEDPDGQGRAGEDRRRERERSRNWSRERDWDRDRARDWDRHRDKDSEREADRGKEWDRSRERSRNRERERERRRDRDRSRSRERERDRDRDRARDRERGRDRKDRSKSKESARDAKPEASRASDAGTASQT
ncbi:hypothetical protein P7K49_010067 [Saguinus oedipus]|uniref:Uncharacterized protein n=1 Tax=Saguinus oedipus TaxID=9490 RepID=A0ABQ9VLR3_SAGOE|nr:hypothetical protein P7K49_010067 [Saguinus oedipus]